MKNLEYAKSRIEKLERDHIHLEKVIKSLSLGKNQTSRELLERKKEKLKVKEELESLKKKVSAAV